MEDVKNTVYALVNPEGVVLDLRSGHHLSDVDKKVWVQIQTSMSLYGLVLYNKEGTPLYKISESVVVKRSDEEVYPIARVRETAISEIKKLVGLALSRTDYIVLRQLDPKDKNRLSDAAFEAIQAKRRQLRDLSNAYEAEVMKAQTKTFVESIVKMVENEPTVRGWG